MAQESKLNDEACKCGCGQNIEDVVDIDLGFDDDCKCSGDCDCGSDCNCTKDNKYNENCTCGDECEDDCKCKDKYLGQGQSSQGAKMYNEHGFQEKEWSNNGCSRCMSGSKKPQEMQEYKIHQPAYCPLICPKNFGNYDKDFWEKGF